jgi:hypothetical protein
MEYGRVTDGRRYSSTAEMAVTPSIWVIRDETFLLKNGFPTFEAENWVLGFVQICNKNGGGG